jgi:hypothetical protein
MGRGAPRKGHVFIPVPTDVIAAAHRVRGWAYDGAQADYCPRSGACTVTLHLAHRGGFMVPGARFWRRHTRWAESCHVSVEHGRATVTLRGQKPRGQ